MKKGYLTLDDSPTSKMSEKVDYLKKKSIPAIFFCVGKRMESHQDQVIDAIKKGFIIGNHSYSHPNFSYTDLNTCFDEITKTDEIIESLYEKAGVKRIFKFFRYPYGVKVDYRHNDLKVVFRKYNSRFMAIERHLNSLGYQSFRIESPKLRFPEILRIWDTDVYWTLDLLEWKIISPKNNHRYEYVVNYMDKKLKYRKGNEIFLLHDHEETHKYFENIIDHLLQLGFHFQHFYKTEKYLK